ncbi:hypothetical protein B7Y94_03500 [Candidatus Saccharibacteria bacterium 32-49-12]|nr:MAG: hypothetical protein B7Y94_03500 [Candidatus Saccharibacteria bacterium 32-49-12]
MDKSQEYNSGVYDTYGEAVSKCKAILDDFLESAYQPGDTAETLYSTYVHYGETPIIWGDNLGDFDSNDYARLRCREIVKLHQPRIKKFIRDIDNE